MIQTELISIPTAHRDAEDGTGASDHWFTPIHIFAGLHERHRFTVDAAGHPEAPATSIIKRCWTIEDNGLVQPWRNERVWCNPPFTNVAGFVAKAAAEMSSPFALRPELVVMLMPANRTEQPFWQEHIEQYRDQDRRFFGTTITTQFLPRRFKFGSPGDRHGERGQSPQFGCVLVTWRRS